MDLLNALLMLLMNGPSLKNEDEVLETVKKGVANYEPLLYQKSRIVEKYNTNKKSDIADQTVIDLNFKEIKQNTEATLENLEQEHDKKYIQTSSESDESCSSEEDEDSY